MADENAVLDADPPEAVAEATREGWCPQEQWRGKPEDWVSATTFLERGKSILPIVNAKNKRLEQEVNDLRGQLGEAAVAIRASNAAIAALQESQDEDTRAQVEAARQEVKDALAAASEAGDHKGVADLTDKLTQLGTAEEKAAKKPNGADDSKPPELHPEVKTWLAGHTEFTADRRRVALANAVAQEFREKGDKRVGKEFLDDVMAEVEKDLAGGKQRGGDGKVESGNGGGGRGASGAKSYADLPPEAKAACDKLSKQLVGPNRAHKDQASWRKSYVSQFFNE